MKVLFVAAEVTPIAKVGGLADVIGALPKALERLGVKVTILVPFYSVIRERHLKKAGAPLKVQSRGRVENIELFETKLPGSSVRLILAKHPLLSRPAIYGEADDPDRFALFSAVALKFISKDKFDLVHAHDWHTALVPFGIQRARESNERWANVPTVMTVHNVHPGEGIDHIYRHVLSEMGFPAEKMVITDDVRSDSVNLLAQGVVSADAITTVSPTHAKEIQQEQFGGFLSVLFAKRKGSLLGILNGIDTEVFDPARDHFIRLRYGPKTLQRKRENKWALESEMGWSQSSSPLLGMVARLTEQKGSDLIAYSGKEIRKRGLRVIILGTGDPRHEALVYKLQDQFPDAFRVFIKFDAAFAQRIYAGADMFLMPSRFEPCGLGQMIAMRYGTVPIAHRTGGLIDTVKERRTGFLFSPFNKNAFLVALQKAVVAYNKKDKWQRMQQEAMKQDFSWGRSAKEYLRLYRRLVGRLNA